MGVIVALRVRVLAYIHWWWWWSPECSLGNAITLFMVCSFTLKRGGCIGDVEMKLYALCSSRFT